MFEQLGPVILRRCGHYAYIFKSHSNPARLRFNLTEHRGQVFGDEQAIILQLQWVLWNQQAHVTCRLANGNLEQNQALGFHGNDHFRYRVVTMILK